LTILFLDDSKKRIKRFKAANPHAHTVETAEECIAALENQKWTEVYLDHDLGGEAWVDSNRADTGFEVVRWIVKNKPEVKRFTVHSHNHLAAPLMARALMNAGYQVRYVPFNKLMKR